MPVFPLLFLLFVFVPLLELRLLFLVARRIGGWETVALVILTGMAGAHLARYEGARVIGGLRNDLREGRLPADRLLSGAMVLVGGVLLVTPGILTDGVGLLLMVPRVRRVLAAPLKAWLRCHFHLHGFPADQGAPFAAPPADGTVREVDARDVSDEIEDDRGT